MITINSKDIASKDPLHVFLSPTEYCDYHHPHLQELAKDLTYGCTTDKEKAVRIFYWVRDNIHYKLGFWNKKASETLDELEGTCTNKANLFVALCRTSNIHAGYGIMKVNGQLYFGPAMIPMLKQFVQRESVHIYATVYLNNHWIIVDPSDDRHILNLIRNVIPKSDARHDIYDTISWDGTNDAKLKLCAEHILSDNSPIESIDQYMKKPLSLKKGIVFGCINLFIRECRRKNQPFSNTRSILWFTLWQLVKRPILLIGIIIAIIMNMFPNKTLPGLDSIEYVTNHNVLR